MVFIIWLLHYLASPVGTTNYQLAGWAQNQISKEGTCCRRKFASLQAPSCLSPLGKICMSSVVHMVQKVCFSWENLLWRNTQKLPLSPSCSSSFFASYTTRALATRKPNSSALQSPKCMWIILFILMTELGSMWPHCPTTVQKLGIGRDSTCQNCGYLIHVALAQKSCKF